MTATFKVSKGMFRTVTKWGNKKIQDDEKALGTFWQKIGDGHRRGVYVFGIRAGRGFTPLYVGRTTRQTLKTRVEQHIDSGKFNGMLKPIRKGTPMLFLLSRVGKGRRSKGAIEELEIEFINHAFGKNPDLHNDRGIRKRRYLIQGFGKGRPSDAVMGLKAMVGYPGRGDDT